MTVKDIESIMRQYGKYQNVVKDYHRFRADKEENRHHKANQTVEYLHFIEKI